GRLPPPGTVRIGSFTTFSLRPILQRLSRVLPAYPEADGVRIARAFFAADSGLVLAGSTTKADAVRPDLVEIISSKAVLALDSKKKVRLILDKQPGDPDHAKRIVLQGVEALVGDRIANFDLESLNQAIFLDPVNSTAWYLRAAHYFVKDDPEQAKRDMRRALRLEAGSDRLKRERGFLFGGFRSPRRSR